MILRAGQARNEAGDAPPLLPPPPALALAWQSSSPPPSLSRSTCFLVGCRKVQSVHRCVANPRMSHNPRGSLQGVLIVSFFRLPSLGVTALSTSSFFSSSSSPRMWSTFSRLSAFRAGASGKGVPALWELRDPGLKREGEQ